MRWRNTPDSFGLVSRLLHWTMAFGVLGMLGLGTTIARMQPSLANLWLFGLHKSLGLTLFSLVMLRMIWHLYSPPPSPLGRSTDLKVHAARTTHWLLYGCLLAVPLSGWLASSATGIDVVLFDRWIIPQIAPISEVWEKAGFAVHGILTKLFFGLILLHFFGAVLRGLAKDGTLRRMVFGSARARTSSKAQTDLRQRS